MNFIRGLVTGALLILILNAIGQKAEPKFGQCREMDGRIFYEMTPKGFRMRLGGDGS